MPDRLSYDEAMSYSKYTLKIQDTDLLQGSVETYSIQTSVREMKKPWGVEGGFAVVYKFRAQSGQLKAMRCFRVAMNVDTQTRYERMSAYFQKHAPDITIDFRYYIDGILVKESMQSANKIVCPVIVMEWIEGVTLLEKVDELCKRRDTQTLERLAERWLGVVNKLHQAHIAHGDLAGVNIMVRRNEELVLVDYDGVFIPDFQGLPQVVLGQQGYQHPDMTNRPFSEHMDGFSALVIYLSLLALKTQPELWDKYTHRSTSGQLDGSMLFTTDDFLSPYSSHIFADMLASAHPQVCELARILQNQCSQPIERAAFPLHLLDPDYHVKQSLQKLEAALRQEDDDAVIQLWTQPLSTYQPAQRYQQNVVEVRRRLALLDAFDRALATGDIFKIADAATSEVTASKKIGSAERTIAGYAIAFAQAHRNNDETRMVDLWQEIERGQYKTRLRLDPKELTRIRMAIERKEAVSRFRKIRYLQGSKPNASPLYGMYERYKDHLDNSHALTKEERQLLEDAGRYMTMYNAITAILQKREDQRDLSQFLDVYDEDLYKKFHDFLPEQQREIAKLLSRARLEQALAMNAPAGMTLTRAREVEEESQTIVADVRLNQARVNFIKTYDAKNLQIQARQGQALASWDWPRHDLIQLAALVWRTDRWPEHPETPDPGREILWVNRSVYDMFRCYQFQVGSAQQLYVQVYLVVSGFVGPTRKMFYSPASDATSRWSGVITQ